MLHGCLGSSLALCRTLRELSVMHKATANAEYAEQEREALCSLGPSIGSFDGSSARFATDWQKRPHWMNGQDSHFFIMSCMTSPHTKPLCPNRPWSKVWSHKVSVASMTDGALQVDAALHIQRHARPARTPQFCLGTHAIRSCHCCKWRLLRAQFHTGWSSDSVQDSLSIVSTCWLRKRPGSSSDAIGMSSTCDSCCRSCCLAASCCSTC